VEVVVEHNWWILRETGGETRRLVVDMEQVVGYGTEWWVGHRLVNWIWNFHMVQEMEVVQVQKPEPDVYYSWWVITNAIQEQGRTQDIYNRLWQRSPII
jgi:hypothetical protein